MRFGFSVARSACVIEYAAAFDAEYPPIAGKLPNAVSERTFTTAALPPARASTGSNAFTIASVPWTFVRKSASMSAGLDPSTSADVRTPALVMSSVTSPAACAAAAI